MTMMSTPRTPREVQLTQLTFLERAAAVFPDRKAIVAGGISYTYGEFAAETQRVAHSFKSSGLAGERIAYLCPNGPEILIGHFAVPLAGAILVPINTRLSRHEVRYILEHSEAR